MAPTADPLGPGRSRGTVWFAPLAARPEDGESPLVAFVAADAWDGYEPRPPVVGCLVEGEGRSPHPTGPPAVGDVDRDLVRTGERVEIDGDAGTFRIEGTEETEVVTAFLQREDGRVLLLRRSDRVRTFRGRWAGVSGYVEKVPPLQQAVAEISEEVGLEPGAVRWKASGRRVLARTGRTIFVVHPFLFEVLRPSFRLDWEHTTAEWVEPAEILRRETVPKLGRAWAAVARGGLRGKS